MDLYLNDKIYIKDIQYANTFTSRLKGYMFVKRPKYTAIVIYPCNSIHTFFMKFAIDVLFLDKSMVVIETKYNMIKNKIVPPIKDSVYVVEAKAGTFTEVSIGDTISLC